MAILKRTNGEVIVESSDNDIRTLIIKNKNNLGYANLRDANLGNANLWNANLRDANLGYADLWNADLWNADLRNADLWNANLRDANLRDANLWNADLRNAKWSEKTKWPSPAVILSAIWSDAPDRLIRDMLVVDMNSHPNKKDFLVWAKDGPCPYADCNVQPVCGGMGIHTRHKVLCTKDLLKKRPRNLYALAMDLLKTCCCFVEDEKEE